MISYLAGRAQKTEPAAPSTSKEPTSSLTILTASGVGYEVFVPFPLWQKIPGDGQQASGRELALHVFTLWQQDNLRLYGFATPEERRWFGVLTAVSGVGPRVALTMLSAFRVLELRAAIQDENIALLTTISGVGPKLARRLCLELSGKLPPPDPESSSISSDPENEDHRSDLRSALLNLGFAHQEVERVLPQVLQTLPDDPSSASSSQDRFAVLLREALSQLQSR